MILQNNEAAGWFDQFQDDRYLLSILTRQIDDLHKPGQATDLAGQFCAQEVVDELVQGPIVPVSK